MPLASALLWANTTANLSYYRFSDIWDSEHRILMDISYSSWFSATYGWPYPAFIIVRHRGEAQYWEWTNLLLDVGYSMGLLLATGIICEYAIRRRARRGVPDGK